MSENYDHRKVEKKWQNFWEENKTFKAAEKSKKQKFYVLDMFPYPSGAGLHVGHPEGYTASDIIARKKRMNNFEVLHPMGWDAFGLPAENYAIKTGTHPKLTTEENIKVFTRQIKSLGFSYDWDREIDSTDPKYFKWTQWIFLKLFNSYFDEQENKALPIEKLAEKFEQDGTFDGKSTKEKNAILANYRLAYEKEAPINFCPSCKTGLANEEVVDGKCERCGEEVTRKNLRQWILRITNYAERLLNDLRPTKVLIIHGFSGEPDGGWKPWLKNCLTEKGFDVKVPALPNTAHPNFDETIKFLEKETENFGENDVLVGHSLGGHFALKLAEKKKFGKIILVAPAIGDLPYDYFRKGWPDSDIDSLEKVIIENKVDYSKTKAVQKIAFFSINDHQVPFENRKVLNKDWQINELENRGHIDQDELPEILDIFEQETKNILDWPEKIRLMQQNWIGKSHGAEVDFIVDQELVFEGNFGNGESSVYMITFNTENGKVLNENIAKDLNEIFKKIAKENNFEIWAGVVMPNHVHLLVADYEAREMGKLVQLIKGSSSRYIKITPDLSQGLSVTKNHQHFGHEYQKVWRDGYNFTIIKSAEDLERAIQYIKENPAKEDIDPKNRLYDPREKIRIFTTRPDTLFGATYFVLSPEHPLVAKITTPKQKNEVEKYIEDSAKKSDLQRTDLAKDKTGVFTGGFVINPVNNEKIPVWIADYVLMSYGTGAIMAVPAHDERDFEFAKKFDLPIIEVVANPRLKSGDIINIDSNMDQADMRSEINSDFSQELLDLKLQSHNDNLGLQSEKQSEKCFAGDGMAINSGFLNELKTPDAIEKMISYLEEKVIGERKVNYKMRDWIFSRQRYWGEPIPVVHCDKCGTVALSKEDLPIELPVVEKYEPSGTGESPLVNIADWVNTKCPNCGDDGKRETNTMPQWAGSSWYWLRFMDAQNSEEFCSAEKEEYWGPVDLYVGGAEHAVLHLLYSRFWHKVLFDLGFVSTREPFKSLKNQGMILAEDGQKMSKSLGNVVNPDEIVEKYGADTLRVYEMFMGPFEQAKAWSSGAVEGTYRFLHKIWKLFNEKELVDCGRNCGDQFGNLPHLLHKTVKKVSEDVDNFKFNTAISQMMIFTNEAQKFDKLPKFAMENICKIISPFAPHLAEEIWREVLGYKNTIAYEKWPEWNEELAKEDQINLAIQINGKLRATILVSADISKEEALSLAKSDEKVQKWLEGTEIIKEIFVPGKIVNLVVK